MRRLQRLLASIAVVGVLAAACAPAAPAGPKPKVIMGSTNFSEQLIVAELYGQALEANGYTVERKLNLGSREIVAPALEKGEITIYPEYLATYLGYVSKDPERAHADPATTHKRLEEALKGKNIAVLDYAPAQDQNVFVVTKQTSEKYGLKKVSDLTRHNKLLTLGGPPECPQRPFCLLGLKNVYGFEEKEFKALDVGGPITVQALEGNQVDVGLLFTTDPQIGLKGFVALQDDKGLQRSDNVAPVVHLNLLNQAPSDFRSILSGVSARLTTEELMKLNQSVGVDKKEPKDVAAAWLKDKKLVM